MLCEWLVRVTISLRVDSFPWYTVESETFCLTVVQCDFQMSLKQLSDSREAAYRCMFAMDN